MNRRLVFIARRDWAKGYPQRMRLASLACALLGLLSLIPSVARGGMGSVVPTDWAHTMRLTESAHGRFQAISFFLVVLLFSALLVRWLWNRLVKDLPRLPRLTFGKSLAVVVIWGLLCLVVLTMIAATREMMTPGAWRKVGMLYEVVDSRTPPESVDRIAQRTQHFERLRTALWDYAAQHDGRFPDRTDAGIPASLWEVPGGAGLTYVYVPHRPAYKPSAIVAYEPALYGDDRLVLYSSGKIELAKTADIQQALRK